MCTATTSTKKTRAFVGAQFYFEWFLVIFSQMSVLKHSLEGFWTHLHVSDHSKHSQDPVRLLYTMYMIHIRLFDNTDSFNRFSVTRTDHYQSLDVVQWTKVNLHIRRALPELAEFNALLQQETDLKVLHCSANASRCLFGLSQWVPATENHLKGPALFS